MENLVTREWLEGDPSLAGSPTVVSWINKKSTSCSHTYLIDVWDHNDNMEECQASHVLKEGNEAANFDAGIACSMTHNIIWIGGFPKLPHVY